MAAGVAVSSVGGGSIGPIRTEVANMPVAIVQGASRGLGRALAAGLAAAGRRVVLDGRDAEALREAAVAIGPAAVAVPGDVTDPAHRAALIAAADQLGGPDLLVNNAGILGPSPRPPL